MSSPRQQKYFKVDFQAVNHAALNRFNELVELWCPGGRYEGNEYVPRNPTRDDKKPGSFKINKDTGQWFENATGEYGGDLISLYAYLNGVTQLEAAKALAEYLHIEFNTPRCNRKKMSSKKADWEPFLPIPEDAPGSDHRHPKFGLPSRVWLYLDCEGNPLSYVCRFDLPDGGKAILPHTFGHDGKGNRHWDWKGVPAPRSLYGLDILAQAEATVPVLIMEGEKAADAARDLVGDSMVAMTWPSGSNSVHLADWSPVKDRAVKIWPDADKPGFEAALKVAELAVIEQAASVSIVVPPANAPKGWDLADATDWDSKRTLELIENNQVDREGFKCLALERYGIDDKPQTSPSASPGFKLKEDGVYRTKIVSSGELVEEMVCSPLEVLALTRDKDNQSWGKLLQVTDPDGNDHKWAMSMEMTAMAGEPFRQHLASLGLRLAPGRYSKARLLEYIVQTDPEARALCVPRTGWHGDTFVLPDQTYGVHGEEQVILQRLCNDNPYKLSGSLKEWQDSVGTWCQGNSRLAFGVSVAFAAVMQHHAGAESGGFHFIGSSSIGKTTVLMAAASVCGGGGDAGYIRQWRATDNGIEAIAASCCDTLLCLDEMGQADSKVVAEGAYLLANGVGKLRATKVGSTASINAWRSCFLSTGETSLNDKLLEDQRLRAKAGHAVRIVDIPADAGCDLGAFEKIHGFGNGEEFARAISQAATSYYGTPLRAFLEKLMDNLDAHCKRHSQLRHTFYNTHCPIEADGQVKRACRRFAHVAASGELAAEIGILPWESAEASKAAMDCFHAWLNHRGGKGAAEKLEGLRQVRAFFEKYASSRFELIGSKNSESSEPQVIVESYNRAGFRNEDDEGNAEFWMFPEAFREVCQGFDHKMVCRMLAEQGILKTQTSGSFQMAKRLPGMGVKSLKKVYVITSKIFKE
ncbi:DUF927 domain-containing protein [Pseudodesulfovibrio cashew]|nr:DUF927 domain-containing protein [Pseudodesulfovibrio cashew]